MDFGKYLEEKRKSRNTIPPDIEEYLKQNKELIEEIRRIKRGRR